MTGAGGGVGVRTLVWWSAMQAIGERARELGWLVGWLVGNEGEIVGKSLGM